MNNRIITLFLMLSTAALSAQDKPFLEDIPYYVENLSVFELNQENSSAHHIPDKSISLNGQWKFRYAGFFHDYKMAQTHKVLNTNNLRYSRSLNLPTLNIVSY